MKHYLSLFTLCLSIIFLSCNDDNSSDSISISKDQLNQSAYANASERGITFTAQEAWKTEINYNSATKATDTSNWITLDPPSGEAGTVTVKILLSPNYTGTGRKATIRIICGGSSITVTIEQKGQTEEGNTPIDPERPDQYKKLVSKIEITNTHYGSSGNLTHKSERLFTYDELNRISTYEEYDYTDNKRMLDWSDSYSYSGNTITCLEKVEDQNQIFEYKTIYKLDEEQNVKTWTCEYNEIGKPEIDQGELSYENGYFSSSRTEVSNSGPTTDQAIWVDGNLVKAGETDEPRATTNIEYSHIPNNSNVDFNYLLSQTEWLDCLAFEESGIKAFGCFGKRSAYLMSKEKDGYNNDEHVFEYRTDNEGYIREITVRTYDGQHQVSSKRIHTISYIDAN